MRYMKVMSIAAMAMAATALLVAGSASATTLEVGGTPKTEPVSLTMSLKSGTSLTLRDTFGFFANTCSESHVAGKTETNFSTTPTGKISELTFGKCAHTVTVHKLGNLYIEWLSGTNGRVYSEEAEVTFYSTIHGTHINCKTEEGTSLGTLTGVKEGHATLDVNATLNCGSGHMSSAKLTGTYTVTSPTGLGVANPTPLPPTLEVGGTPKTESVALTMSLKSGTSLTLRDTLGFFANTCSESHIGGRTEQEHTETTVTGPVEELTFGKCAHTVTVHKLGNLYIEWLSGTNGRVYSEEAEVTFYSTIHGTHINCKTEEGTSLGTLTGVKEGHATLDVNATLNCGPHMSSAKLTGTYTVTSPTGLGVSPP